MIEPPQDFDVAVIGAGVAGLTAATTAARLGATVAVIERLAPGGQIMNAAHIANWPGAPAPLSGLELGASLYDQATAAGAEILLDTVSAVERDGERCIIVGSEASYRARAVIIAAGSSFRSAGIPGEDRQRGRGVSHCAACDGPLSRGRPVCVIGGGDSAVDEAICLAQSAASVSLFHRGPRLDAQPTVAARLSAASNIAVHFDTVVEEIIGGDRVEAVRVRHNGAVHTHAVAAVFIYVGLAPDTAFLRGVVDLDATGHVVTDANMRTSSPGIFAAGDIRAGSAATLTAVAGDGETAAHAAWRSLDPRR